MNKVLSTLKIFLIYLIIFLSVFAVSTLALARKVNKYKTSFNNATFQVEKEIIVLSNPVGGRVESVNVSAGQQVKQGDILVILSDDSFSSRLGVLEQFADENLSARTEAELLRLQKNDYIITAPRNGTVKEIELAQGSFVPANTKLITLYSDEDARLTTVVDTLALDKIQKTNKLEVFSKRLEQSFYVELVGISEVNPETGKYEVIFKFVEPENSTYFISGETVEAVPVQSADVRRPAEIITDIWNGLIIQEQS